MNGCNSDNGANPRETDQSPQDVVNLSIELSTGKSNKSVANSTLSDIDGINKS